MSLLSDRLTERRKSKGWTRKVAVAHLNVPYSTYAGYEQGYREPDINILREIANSYDTTIDYLTGRTDDPSTGNDQASITDTDLDKMIDNARSFDGKPMDDHDREVIKNMLKGYYIGKEG